MYILYMNTPKFKSPSVVRKSIKGSKMAKPATGFKLGKPRLAKLGEPTVINVVGFKHHEPLMDPYVNITRNTAKLRGDIRDRLREALGAAVEVNITEARAQMPQMVKYSTAGRGTYLIGSARNRETRPAVLIGMDELERVVQVAANPPPSRTLGDILDTLPFPGMDLPRLKLKALPGGGLPNLRLPK
jgi:hypothetical protein